MEIIKEQNDNKLTLKIQGRLDTTTSPMLEGVLKDSLPGLTDLVFDLSELEYISSAGLRVLLSAQKTMNKQGSMVVAHASAEVKEIFEITGFSDILTLAD